MLIFVECDGRSFNAEGNPCIYIGGMGAQKRNFHTELMSRMGYDREANEIQSLFLSGKRNEAIQQFRMHLRMKFRWLGPSKE